ncbi:hypothetical protein MUK42_35870 [Musa troglodytarum]|uniref:MHD1 domain-containing protein n=1 Tax=Musa troglodytarum TaxID=320322 RepID=A0A9E7KPM3_9LILI|nr:hypothetical protein MUK42_35870 [Musa troglodytarum]
MKPILCHLKLDYLCVLFFHQRKQKLSQWLRQIMCVDSVKPIETGRNSQSMQVLWSAVMFFACRSPKDLLWIFATGLMWREETDVARSRVDTYIQSSLRTAFVQRMELADSGRLSSKNQNTSTPVLSILKWRSLAAGVAVAALPSCYGDELKEFILNTTELTPDTDEVLKAADKYGGNKDGGKSLIKEMPPSEVDSAIDNLVKVWIKKRAHKRKEYVDQNSHKSHDSSQANTNQDSESDCDGKSITLGQLFKHSNGYASREHHVLKLDDFGLGGTSGSDEPTIINALANHIMQECLYDLITLNGKMLKGWLHEVIFLALCKTISCTPYSPWKRP